MNFSLKRCGQLVSRVRTRAGEAAERGQKPEQSVAHLYSMGINSAARLTCAGLSVAEIPTRKESVFANQDGRVVLASNLLLSTFIII